MISKLIQVKTVHQNSIWLTYDDGTEGVVDLSHLLNNPIFQNWKEPDFFGKVYIDVETRAVAWDENMELCTDSLYLKIKGVTFEQWKNSQYSYENIGKISPLE